MATRTCTINGHTHWPSRVRGGRRKVGEVLEADDGGATLVATGQKGEWTLEWDRPKESVANALEAIYLLTTNIPFIFEGVTYTVFVPPDGFERTWDHRDSRSANATVFSCTMTLREA